MKGKRSRARGRSSLLVWARRGFLVLLALAVAPLVLTFVYLPPMVHPISTLMVRDVVALRGYDRQWVSIGDMGPRVIHSVMMSEDGQFCSHKGIDWAELNLVIEDALSGEATRGASTITMQTVKNLYLWPGRSVIRKMLELPLAVYFDLFVPKKRIMEIYMNIAEWGPGIYGVEAAARYHFGRSARDLTSRQAALLAVTLPNPHLRDPANPTRNLGRIAATIERRAQRAGGYVGCLR
ncbi:transglycosylase domain-containing protein [Aquamicrobium sp. LC103]|uniref:transglycosylase domain-containing protein n=1 Tax=Aquamicrobium sp. LC103 TaxID=1120658 RepID=UPI00063EB3B1|nr:transglycosylase domain-containing protein [Aquamicrobium sp. LC103]TKT75508.1 monofunctional biosynthetic peptidoglycan transglycosylase [Aquamicrobium sp. LC103]